MCNTDTDDEFPLIVDIGGCPTVALELFFYVSEKTIILSE